MNEQMTIKEWQSIEGHRPRVMTKLVSGLPVRVGMIDEDEAQILVFDDAGVTYSLPYDETIIVEVQNVRV